MKVEPGNISLNKLLFHLYYNPPGRGCQEQNAKTFLFLSLFITFLGREFNIMSLIGLCAIRVSSGCHPGVIRVSYSLTKKVIIIIYFLIFPDMGLTNIDMGITLRLSFRQAE